MISSYRMAFREWFGLAPAQADVLVMLYAAHGSPQRSTDIAKAFRVSKGSVYQCILKLRGALTTEALDYSELGYYLTEDGLAECRAALWKMGEELRGAA